MVNSSIPHALTLFGGVRFIAWRLKNAFLEESRRGSEEFLELTHLKRPCATLVCQVKSLSNIARLLVSTTFARPGLLPWLPHPPRANLPLNFHARSWSRLTAVDSAKEVERSSQLVIPLNRGRLSQEADHLQVHYRSTHVLVRRDPV